MIPIDIISYTCSVKVKACTMLQTPAVSEDLPLKRNEAYATVSGVLMQRNEAYSVVVPRQRNDNVVRPTNTLGAHTSPEYEII